MQAASLAGLEPDDLLDRLRSSLNRQELLAAALEAAAHATFEAKVRALGEAIRTGALAPTDPAVDHELMFVRAIADLEVVHLVILGHLARLGTKPLTPPAMEELARLPGVDTLAVPVVATLERHGAIESVPLDVGKMFEDFQRSLPRGMSPNTPDPTWRVTSFGLECLARVKSAGPSDPPAHPAQ